MKPLCIYHGGCDDGFASAWAVRQALGDNVEFHAGIYQKEPPDVTGRDVLLVDFSYKRPVLLKMAESAASILILDHHKTAQEDLAGFGLPPAWDQWAMYACAVEPPRIACLFDMERSGAGLTWDYFHSPQTRPEFINYIEDRDLWRKKLPDGDAFTMALRSYPQDFAVWATLSVPSLIAEGRAILRYYRLRVEELKKHAYLSSINGVPCYIANAPYSLASEVAGEIAEMPGASFGACYFEVERGRFQYSLRSRGEFDVSAIAKQFGGGGHKNAAGFTISGENGAILRDRRGVAGEPT